jgi:hypothetical protein
MPQLQMRSIDNMHFSRDFMCYQRTAAEINAVVNDEVAAHVDTVTVDMPYDSAGNYKNCTPPNPAAYEAEWISIIRAHGLHVWFRQMWNNWEGNYGTPKLTYTTSPAISYGGDANAVLNGTDTTSYMAMTYHFILNHPSFFRSGDIFTPESEPENAGIIPWCTAPCQFPSYAAADAWYYNSMYLDRAAFARIGVSARVGYWGLTCSSNYLSAATIQSMGVYDTDCYFKSASDVVSHLQWVHNRYGVPVVLGEWGDIWDGGNLALLVPEIDSVYSALRQQPYLVGISYWQGYGGNQGEGIVDKTTMTLNAAGARIQYWFS